MKMKKICSQILAISLILFGILNTTVMVKAEDIIRLHSTFTMEEHTEGAEIIFKADLDSVQAYKLADNTQVITGLKPILLQNDCKFVLTDGTNYVFSKSDGTWIESADFNIAKESAEVVTADTIDLTYFATPTYQEYSEYTINCFDEQVLYIIMDDDITYATPLTDLFNEFACLGDSYYTAWNWSYVSYEDGIYVGHLSEGLRVELKYFSNIVIQEGTNYDVTENNSTNMVLTGEDKITNVIYDNNKAEMQIYYQLGKLKDLTGTEYENSVSNIEIYGPNNMEIGSYSVFKSNENDVITIENIILPEKGTYKILLDTPFMSYISGYIIGNFELEITEDDLSVKIIEEDYIDIEIDFRSNTEAAKLKLTSHFGNSYIYTFNEEQINTESATSVIVEVNQNGEFEYKAKNNDTEITGYYFVSCFSNETLETIEEPEILEAEPLEEEWLTNIVEKLWQTGLYDNFDFKTVGIICILSGIALILIPNKKVRKVFSKKESK